MDPTRTMADVRVSQPAYSILCHPGSPWTRLEDQAGAWAELCLVANADTTAGPDETYAIEGPTVQRLDHSTRISWRLRSTAWSAKTLTIDADEDGLGVRLEVTGHGWLTDVTLLGGQAALPGGRSGSFWSRRAFPTLLPAAPGDPARVVVGAESAADSTVSGGGEPGRPGWFFTPAPFWFGATREPIRDPQEPPAGRWLGFGLEAAPEEQRFLGLGYRGTDAGFRFALDYQGKTAVDGTWASPALRLSFGDEPYGLLAGYREGLAAKGFMPAAATGTPRPDWWREPLFCGWGAQCAAALADGRTITAAPEYSTQARYDAWLDHLEARGVVPGTVVVDDGWAAQYALPEPHPDRWPDLRTWIRRRRDRGQRVLLWWKAWDPTGLEADLCVCTPEGRPIALDPNHDEALRTVTDGTRMMLSSDGLDADGLKIDFTARTPSGATLHHAPGDWGVALLRRLLVGVHRAAKTAKPDALLVGQVPEPSLAGVVDMIRLNDILRLDDPTPATSIVTQMRYRAAVVRAACPDHLIDTDDWCVPDLEAWRAYASVKPELGVPSLYYGDRLDLSGESLTDVDYALLRRTWAEYREREGLPAR